MIEIEAMGTKTSQKYRFNILDHLHYVVGEDRLHTIPRKWRFSPLDVAVIVFFSPPILILSLFLPYMALQIAVATIGIMALSNYDSLLKKRFTSERERAYYRRYPNRMNCSIWLLIGIDIAIIGVPYLTCYIIAICVNP